MHRMHRSRHTKGRCAGGAPGRVSYPNLLPDCAVFMLFLASIPRTLQIECMKTTCMDEKRFFWYLGVN